jgi:hypothetical protein
VTGRSRAGKLAFVFMPEGIKKAKLRFSKDFFDKPALNDLMTGSQFKADSNGTWEIKRNDWGITLLSERPE